MSRTTDRNMPDDHFAGYMVSVCHHGSGFVTSFPFVTLRDLALELADMLSGIYSDSEVRITRHAYPLTWYTKAKATTDRIEHRIIEARTSASPGRAFLESIGYRFDKE